MVIIGRICTANFDGGNYVIACRQVKKLVDGWKYPIVNAISNILNQ